jgi:hypothetical protein
METSLFRSTLVATIIVCLAAVAALAAPIDGKWFSEMKVTRQDGEETTWKVTMDLKSQGQTLTGTVTIETPRGARPADVQNGKLDGNNFSFLVVRETPRGEMKTMWEGAVEGDEMKGTQSREGGDRKFPFTAKRQ